MFNGLMIGSSGMKTAQNVMDNVADQISNASTSGYKQKQVDFSELLVNQISKSQVELSENAQDSAISAGSRAVISKTDFSQGVITPSDSSFHMALEGRGFFGVVSQQGELMLTRNGAFHQNADNSVTDDSGNRLSMDCYVPPAQWPQSSEVCIGADGAVTAIGEQGSILKLGKVIIYAPQNSDELVSLGEGRYSQQQGLPLYNSADNPEIGYGALRQKALESSNVDTIKSMTDMIMTQRAYQVNAKSITTADDMLEVINTIF
jgi:flagellar basal-body rod protein FlgG